MNEEEIYESQCARVRRRESEYPCYIRYHYMMSIIHREMCRQCAHYYRDLRDRESARVCVEQ
jgi:hypothetical protein